MATRYFKADLNGKTHYRTTTSRVYVALCEGRYGLGWVSRMDLIPSAAPWAKAKEITKAEYNEARREKVQARSVVEQLWRAQRSLWRAQADQRYAGRCILAWSMTRLGYSVEAIFAEKLYSADAMTEQVFIQRQRDQASAYKRIVKYSKLVAELERAAA